MSTRNKQHRQYKRITPQTVAQFTAEELAAGNGAVAVRNLESTRLSPRSRAFRIRTKRNEENSIDFIEDTMQQIGVDAIQRVGKMVNSSDERIATKNAHFVIDHLRGKAVQRSESKHLNLTIETVLE